MQLQGAIGEVFGGQIELGGIAGEVKIAILDSIQKKLLGTADEFITAATIHNRVGGNRPFQDRNGFVPFADYGEISGFISSAASIKRQRIQQVVAGFKTDIGIDSLFGCGIGVGGTQLFKYRVKFFVEALLRNDIAAR